MVLLAGNDNDSDDNAVSTNPGPEEQAEALLHVHGLGVNPADAALYVATHSGLFRLSGHGDAALVGSHRYDLMGFSVAGHDRFLASGHPDVAGIRAGLPGQLGLIESEDGGGSWEQVSLAGEADLHALAFTGGRGYAVDALTGRLLVTDDLRAWDARAELQATSLAVDPANPDRVVAATGGELRQSLDGGASWEILAGPAVQLVAWDAETGLWGVTADGQAHRRHPETGQWSSLGRVRGEPQAATSEDGVRYVAVHDDERTVIYISNGDGWKAIFDGE